MEQSELLELASWWSDFDDEDLRQLRLVGINSPDDLIQQARRMQDDDGKLKNSQ